MLIYVFCKDTQKTAQFNKNMQKIYNVRAGVFWV